MQFDAALVELYQAPHGSFVDERKRLASALKAAGDKAGAAALAKRSRPTISAWVVNQLWWHASDVFHALLTGAARLRDGDLTATPIHRDALVKLRLRAAAILADAGHGATESILRRVTQTLSAIAATGSWEPDAPGTLAADRDPPGFDAALLAPTAAGDGAAAAQRVVAMTEETRRKAVEVVAAAVAARAVSSSEEPRPTVTVTPPTSTPEGAAVGIQPAPEKAAAVAKSTPEGSTVERSAAKSTPEGATAVAKSTPEGSERLRTARHALAAKEREIEELRVRLADEKAEVTRMRGIVEQLESLLDDA